MHLLILLLLVILLPLRGGVSEAMAATGPHHASAVVHQQALASSSAEHAHSHSDCLDHGMTHAESAPTHHVNDAAQISFDAETTDAACDACSACQTCHAVGLVFSNAVVQSSPVPHVQPATPSQHFASAPALRHLKPPIA